MHSSAIYTSPPFSSSTLSLYLTATSSLELLHTSSTVPSPSLTNDTLVSSSSLLLLLLPFLLPLPVAFPRRRAVFCAVDGDDDDDDDDDDDGL